MTTDVSEEYPAAPVGGSRVLGGAAAATVAAGVVLAGIGAVVDGSSAAAGAVVGGVIAAVVLLLGTIPMNLVAAVMPKLSLAFALLTYLFQLVVLIAALVALDRAGLVGGDLSREWLGAAIMLGVGAWVVAHVVLASRARIPIYRFDVPSAAAVARDAAHPTTDPGAR